MPQPLMRWGSIIGTGIGTGLTCGSATSGCPQPVFRTGLSDGSRIINQDAAGVRYQGAFGGLGVLAYGVYEGQWPCRLHRSRP